MLAGEVAPFIRDADYAIRSPWFTPPRRIMDYLLLFVETGECIATVEDESIPLSRGDVCLIQPDTLHSLRGVTDAAALHIHSGREWTTHLYDGSAEQARAAAEQAVSEFWSGVEEAALRETGELPWSRQQQGITAG